jgi:ATP-dependent Clp protease ATP-binding subunit ClpB
MQHQAVDVEHLLALAEQTEGILVPILQKVGASPRKIGAALREELGKMPKVSAPRRLT